MNVDWAELVRGSRRAPRAELLGGFAAIVAGTLVAIVLTNGLDLDHPARRFLYDVGLPFVLFYAPGVVAAIGASFRCGAATCLGIGLIPAGLFASIAVVGAVLGLPGVGGGDAPLWSITLAFATISIAAATVGYVLGTAGHFGAAILRRRIADGSGDP